MTHDDIEKIAAARAVMKASVEALSDLLSGLEAYLRTDAEENDLFNIYVRKRNETLKREFAEARELAEKCLAASNPAKHYN